MVGKCGQAEKKLPLRAEMRTKLQEEPKCQSAPKAPRGRAAIPSCTVHGSRSSWLALKYRPAPRSSCAHAATQ